MLQHWWPLQRYLHMWLNSRGLKLDRSYRCRGLLSSYAILANERTLYKHQNLIEHKSRVVPNLHYHEHRLSIGVTVYFPLHFVIDGDHAYGDLSDRGSSGANCATVLCLEADTPCWCRLASKKRYVSVHLLCNFCYEPITLLDEDKHTVDEWDGRIRSIKPKNVLWAVSVFLRLLGKDLHTGWYHLEQCE